jgi:hypothetical protein
MSLAEASRAFNTQGFSDVTGANTFKGQTLPYNDGTRSGATTRRRILETDASTVVPEVLVDSGSGEIFIRSTPSIDYFNSSIIRKKYIIAPSDHVYSSISTLGILSGSIAGLVHGAAHYIRRIALEEQSDFLGGYSLLVPTSVSVSAGDFLWFGSSYFRALEDSFADAIGITTVNCVKLDEPFQSLSVTTNGTYDPVAETYATTVATVPCIVEPREKSFINIRQDAEKNMPGDKTIYTLTACGEGDLIGPYKVIYSYNEGLVYILHCRRDG